MSKDEREGDQSRRSFVKKAAYVAPVIITLDAMPAFASHECSWNTKTDDYEKGNNGLGNGLDPQPPGNPPVNDGPGRGRGNPGNRNNSRESTGRGGR
jgi:hypothetical protein